MVACLVRALGERARGLGLERLAGVASLDALRDPATRLPNGMDDALFARAAEGLGMPWLGLWFGAEAADERAFGALGYLARHSSTLGEALSRVVRYGRLFSSAEATEVRIGSESFRIVEGAQGAGDWSPVMGDAVLSTWLALIRRFTRTTVIPIMVEFAHTRPADDTRHRALFGEALRFDGPCYALQFPTAILDLPFFDVDPVLGATIEDQARKLLGLGADESPLLRRIHESLANGATDLDGVAHALALHPRTLQRRLAQLGLDWRTVRDRHRREIAERLLAEPEVSLKKVAAAAGFTDVAGLRRAFMRWNGGEPGASTFR
jgi:AraC-like DNA-binding protein